MKAKSDNTYEVILAGSGGQGLVSSGIMLGEAAIVEGKNVMQTTSYGIAQRGGLSMAEVIISDEEILFQHVQNPDVILALTDDAMNLYAPRTKDGAIIFYDTTLVKRRDGDNMYGYPFIEMASELGHSGMANVIALGAIITKSGVVKIESMESVLCKHFAGKEKIVKMNITAIHKGIELVS